MESNNRLTGVLLSLRLLRISTETLSDTTARLLFRMEETLQFLGSEDNGIFSTGGTAEGPVLSRVEG